MSNNFSIKLSVDLRKVTGRTALHYAVENDYPNFPINPRAHYSSKANFWVRILIETLGCANLFKGAHY